MHLYRVFPFVKTSKIGQVGHPLYVVPNLGTGRINNPDLYQVSYWAKQKESVQFQKRLVDLENGIKIHLKANQTYPVQLTR